MSRSFDSVDDYISLGSAASLNNIGSISIASWVYPKSTGEGGLGKIIAKSLGLPSAGWDFGFISTDRDIRFEVDYSPTDLFRTASAGAIALNAWSFVHTTWNGTVTSTNCKIYVNLVESVYSSSQNGFISRVSDTTTDLKIGNIDNANTTWDGFISHMHLYNRILQLNEARQLMRYPGTVRGGLIAYLPLFGYSPEGDYSNTGNNGAVTGAVIGTVDSPVNSPVYPSLFPL